VPRKVAVVTGGSAGVGRATALELARRGYDVAVLARGRAGLDGAVADIERLGARGLALEADVADFDAVLRAAKEAEDQLGPIDVWVNDAMTTVFSWIGDVGPEEFKRATEVTYLGQVHGTMAALQMMEPRDAGTIVNVGSALAFVGIPLQAAYCGAKFACRGFFESVRAELLHKGSAVRIAMVHLPAVNTTQFGWCENKLPHYPQPVPPIYQPEVPARRIVDAAEKGRSDIVGSWNRLLVAATAVAPTVVAHYAARSAVGAQQTDRPPSATPPNLFDVQDTEKDFGAHGIFDAEANGVRSKQFLKSLPKTAATFAGAVKDTLKDRAASHAGRRGPNA
jgi:NAD(P)-dependent dehydrogenase (short-subunit alcohol dehydrogenase family)